jgi:hypothetical protein
MYGEKDGFTYALIPVVSSGNIKGLEIGAMSLFTFTDNINKTTVMSPSIWYSIEGYWSVFYDLESHINRWYLSGSMSYEDFVDRYYFPTHNGEKNNYFDYDMKRFLMNITVTYKVLEHFSIGMNADFTKVSNKQKDEKYFSDNVLGVNNSHTFGAGLTLVFDSRDNFNSTRKGTYFKASSVFNSNNLVSNFSYQSYLGDYRKFQPIGNKSTLAFQAYIKATNGDVPYYKLPTIAGTNKLRGLGHPNQYINNVAGYVQTEYRYDFTNKIAGVAFAGVGNSSEDFSKELFDDIKYAAGAGIRFMIFPKERLNMRLDVGFGSNNNSSIMIGINESF